MALDEIEERALIEISKMQRLLMTPQILRDENNADSNAHSSLLVLSRVILDSPMVDVQR